MTSPETVSIELDMLDPALIPSPAKIDEIRQIAGEYEGHLLDRPAIGAICRRLIHRLDPDAEYDEERSHRRLAPAPRRVRAGDHFTAAHQPRPGADLPTDRRADPERRVKSPAAYCR